MFDARRLLDQVIAQARTGDLGRAAREAAAGLTGGAGAAGGGAGAGAAGGGALGGRGQFLAGAAAGGLVGLLLGGKGARRALGKGAGTALKLGGLAAVGALAYTAWQRHKAAQAGTVAPEGLLAAPAGGPFLPAPEAAAGQDLARGVLVAMIQGAKADGHIDADEQRRIFGHIEALALDAEAKAFVMDELAAPADIGRIAAHAGSPEAAAELYAAALLAMVPDTPAERAWLEALAARLGLEPGLAREIEATVAAAG